MGRSVPPEKWKAYIAARAEGAGLVKASRMAGIAPATAKRFEMGSRASSGFEYKKSLIEARVKDPVVSVAGCPEAERALEDFEYFRRRYFGRLSTPWQVTAANQVRDLLATDVKEYVVINVPPGSGKSTLFTHDILAWLICRNRAIRILVGSRTQVQARKYAGRLRRTLERTIPSKANQSAAEDAESTLTMDFGRFKPLMGDVWRIDEFVVAQTDDAPIEEKEATVTAFGQDSGFLGGRYDFVIWDDLIDKTNIRTAEARENLQEMWDTEFETRLEPGGLLVLQGQRMAAEDLYRYALNKQAGERDDVDTELDGKLYRHIIYRAHYEDLCDGKSHQGPYPDGCLLDPVRLPWRELSSKMRNNHDKFRVVYQQEDVDPAHQLVQKIWIDGGRGVDGYDYPGCWDTDRGLCELPRGLAQPYYSIASADPSPTKFWAVSWWVYHPETEQHFLMDLIKQSMDAPDFLDYDYNNRVFTGVMDSWQTRSQELGIPITAWIVERNAAQRFLLQYDHVRRWQAKTGVDIIGHDTHRNKTDPEFGVQSLAPDYRYGRVRLPGAQAGGARIASLKLVDEVTRYPEGAQDDCVMSQWFYKWNLPNIALEGVDDSPARRPSWLRKTA